VLTFNVSSQKPDQIACDCLVIPVTHKTSFDQTLKTLDSATQGLLSTLKKQGDLPQKNAATLLLPLVPGCKSKRLLLIATNGKTRLKMSDFNQWCDQAIRTFSTLKLKNISFILGAMHVKGFNEADLTRFLAQKLTNQFNQPGQLKQKPQAEPSWKKATFITQKNTQNSVKKSLKEAEAISSGMLWCKQLGNLPSNQCTPTFLAQEAQTWAKKQAHTRCEVVEEATMKKLGMGAFLSVSQGSSEPGKLVLLHYKPKNPTNKKPIALVGKGITFDTGGISLKPGARMDEMKYDMCGAASVLGTLKAISMLELNVHVIGVLACAENMPGGHASKPGDIVSTMSGQSVEILNTDAEGRLVLCDALTYVQRYKPEAIVDIATLTGACLVALGSQASGLMTNHEALGRELLRAGLASQDRTWLLPLWDEYQQQLDSNFADIANIGTPGAGTITAGCFLSRFCKGVPWAHLDIAGVAWESGSKKGATGRVVPLLTHFLLQRAL
jgi:leucyl aminopeptidase